jgi:predicted nuclease of predicted toxin-antitoxin system
MKLLIDENLPKRLKLDLSNHEVFTVFDKGWNSKKNGELLRLMVEDGIEALITFDKNLHYQQNFDKYPIAVIILNAFDNSYGSVKHFAPKINALIQKGLKTGANVIELN